MSRSTRAAHGFLTSALQYVAQIVLQGLLAPIVLKLAGRETLGAYAILVQTLAYLALIDFGLSYSLERYLAQATARDDGGQHFRHIFTTARTFFLVTNAAFALLIVIASFHVGHIFHFTPAIERQAKLALWVIASWAVLRTPLIAYNIAMVATQDLAAANIIGGFANISRALVSLIAVASGFGLVGLMLAGSVAEAMGSMVFRSRFRRKNPDRIPRWGLPESGLLRQMLAFGGCVFLTSIAGTLAFNSGNVFVGYLFGAAAVSVFYTTQMPTVMGNNIVLRVASSTGPAVNELYGRGDRERLRHIYLRVYRWSILLATLLALGILLFNRDLVVCWVGRRQYGGTLMTACLAAFVLMVALEQVNVLFAFAFGWVRTLSLIAVFQALGNILLALWLGRRLGMGGVILAIVIALAPKTFYLFRRFSRELEIPVASLFYRILSPAVPPAAAGLIVGLAASRYLPGHGWIKFLLEISCFACAYAVTAWLWATTGEDRNTARKALVFMGSAPGVPGSSLTGVESA
jgi:O-antigen/teichoic acid export membrane protein